MARREIRKKDSEPNRSKRLNYLASQYLALARLHVSIAQLFANSAVKRKKKKPDTATEKLTYSQISKSKKRAKK